MIRSNSFALAGVTALALLVVPACSREDAQQNTAASMTSQVPAEAAALPAPVNGWIEHPLKEGAIKLHDAPWRTDTVEIVVPAQGGDLEYKLGMKQGDALVYSIDYGTLEDPGMMVSEFHGHTEKRADGIGDLMFYSKANGATQNGQFVAPWDGVHGWYLKNDSAKDAVVTLKLAGFYQMLEQ